MDLNSRYDHTDATSIPAGLGEAALLVGWRGWVAARDAYRKTKGADFRVREFNDAALKERCGALADFAAAVARTSWSVGRAVCAACPRENRQGTTAAISSYVLGMKL